MRAIVEWIRTNAVIIQSVAALASIAIAIFVYILQRRQKAIAEVQARTGRFTFREIIERHNSPEMRRLRTLVRHDLVHWLDDERQCNEADMDWIEIKTVYEDILNYYEYLGSLLKHKIVDETILLETTHNSAVAIWSIHLDYGSRIRPTETRAKDYAGEFAFLVARAHEYRRVHGLNPTAGAST